MPVIRIGVKGLAKFMTSSSSGQRKVLRDYKYPDEEGTAQAAYYREGRDLIAQFHRAGHDADWLLNKAALLRDMADGIGGRAATRLRHNARSLVEYARNFEPRVFHVLPEKKFILSSSDVRVIILPDLHVTENDRERFMKLEFSKEPPKPDVVKIVSQVMFEAAVQAGVNVKPSDVLYIDIARGASHKGARVGARTRTDIEAACANISAMWPTI